MIFDDKRLGYNPIQTEGNAYHEANTTIAELTNVPFDIFSNGFKLLSTSGSVNASTGEYIYAAFAEFPIVSSNSKPGTAR